MSDRNEMVIHLLRAAGLRAQELTAAGRPTTARALLEGVLVGRFTTEFSNGRVVASVSENGGSTSFSYPAGITPEDVTIISGRALSRLDAYGVDAPTAEMLRPKRRLRMTFHNAMP